VVGARGGGREESEENEGKARRSFPNGKNICGDAPVLRASAGEDKSRSGGRAARAGFGRVGEGCGSGGLGGAMDAAASPTIVRVEGMYAARRWGNPGAR
jgi:hypothetical protein